MSERGSTTPVKINVQVTTRSRAKLLFGLIPQKDIIEGKIYVIALKFRNMSETESFKGKFLAAITFSTKQQEFIGGNVELNSGQEWTLPEESFTAFQEGFALVDIGLKGDKAVQIVDAEGRIIEGAIGGFHIVKARDIYTFYALLANLASLIIIVLKELLGS